jgi:hypothetical protein
VDGISFDSILDVDASWLKRAFEEDVKKVVSAMNGDKAPGPDGFSMAFFQACWDVVRVDIMKVFDEVHARGLFEKSLNASFISLIPKVPGANSIKDFRPISLVGGIYKIIAKVLANKLKLVLEKAISKSQSAFIKGRQILDPIFIAIECIDSRRRSGVPGIICKMDLEKAYDHVNLDFLLYMLRRCGFGKKRCRWIAHCISTVRFSVLISAAVRGGSLEGFKIGDVDFSHLLFADDTLIFCSAHSSQLRNLRSLFLLFEAASGLKVNLTKSNLIPVGHVDQAERLADILGCGFATLPVKYLSLPLGASYKSTHIWDGVVEKIEHRLTSWKMMYLSKGGRVTLIKSTLANVPIYFLFLFHLPRSVAARLEKLQRDFLWGGLGEESKIHLVRWSKVYSPISDGGLGIRNLLMFNHALLGKWLLRYGIEREAWWRVVMSGKLFCN